MQYPTGICAKTDGGNKNQMNGQDEAKRFAEAIAIANVPTLLMVFGAVNRRTYAGWRNPTAPNAPAG
jgi:hypothetical protein